MLLRVSVLFAFLLSLSGCSDDAAAPQNPPAAPIDPEQAGPYVVGTTRFELSAHDARILPVQIWYPATPAAASEATVGHPLSEIEPPGTRRQTLAELVAAAPEGCVSRVMHAALDATPAESGGPWPLILFSHCHVCTRFSELSVAERLASWGFVVAAPDHEGNTLYDELASSPSRLDPEFLQTRGLDVRDVIDALTGDSVDLPVPLQGRLDEARIGMFGHSFGSITTGLVLQNDARVKAGALLAAPPENPILTGVTLSALTKPGFFMLAEEDNAFGAAGNDLIRQNYENYPAAAWLLSVKDAGHWSFSDLAGLIEGFAPGCGTGPRQSDPSQTFSYLDNATARGLTQAYVTAFFGAQFMNDSGAMAYLKTARPEGTVTLTQR